jgi:hypothetical protein
MGKLSFVDLAGILLVWFIKGSEKASDSGATGQHLSETMNINKSLLILGIF